MSNYNFSAAFLGRQTEAKQMEAIKELMDHASRILELLKMPTNSGDVIGTFRADILRHVREIEKLLAVDEKMIDWSKLVQDVKQDLDVGKYWDSERQTYRQNPDGGIDWMGILDQKTEPAKPEKKQDKPGNVGSLFSL